MKLLNRLFSILGKICASDAIYIIPLFFIWLLVKYNQTSFIYWLALPFIITKLIENNQYKKIYRALISSLNKGIIYILIAPLLMGMIFMISQNMAVFLLGFLVALSSLYCFSVNSHEMYILEKETAQDMKWYENPLKLVAIKLKNYFHPKIGKIIDWTDKTILNYFNYKILSALMTFNSLGILFSWPISSYFKNFALFSLMEVYFCITMFLVITIAIMMSIIKLIPYKGKSANKLNDWQIGIKKLFFLPAIIVPAIGFAIFLINIDAATGKEVSPFFLFISVFLIGVLPMLENINTEPSEKV